MGTVKKLADEVDRGLLGALPGLRKTVARKLSLAVGAMIEGQTPKTVELANLLPLETERQDMREQWLRRLLKNPLLLATAVTGLLRGKGWPGRRGTARPCCRAWTRPTWETGWRC